MTLHAAALWQVVSQGSQNNSTNKGGRLGHCKCFFVVMDLECDVESAKRPLDS